MRKRSWASRALSRRLRSSLGASPRLRRRSAEPTADADADRLREPAAARPERPRRARRRRRRPHGARRRRRRGGRGARSRRSTSTTPRGRAGRGGRRPRRRRTPARRPRTRPRSPTSATSSRAPPAPRCRSPTAPGCCRSRRRARPRTWSSDFPGDDELPETQPRRRADLRARDPGRHRAGAAGADWVERARRASGGDGVGSTPSSAARWSRPFATRSTARDDRAGAARSSSTTPASPTPSRPRCRGPRPS